MMDRAPKVTRRIAALSAVLLAMTTAQAQRPEPEPIPAGDTPAATPRPNNPRQGNSNNNANNNNNNNNNTSNNADDGQQAPRESAAERRARRAAAQGENPAGAEAQPATPAPAARPAATPRAPKEAAGSSVGDFQMVIDADSRMLRIHEQGRLDRQNLQVIVGNEFTTEVTFDNKSQLPFDEVRIILAFDGDSIEPLSINDANLAENLLGEPTAEVDPQNGALLYEARLKAPFTLERKPVLSIRWKAKRIQLESAIEFGSRGDFFTAMNGAGRDLLGNERFPGDGTLNMTVNIVPADPREAEALLTDPTIYNRPTEKMGGVRLSLVPQEEPIVVGKPFTVDLVLDNRSFSMLDGIDVMLGFDPEFLEILDVDRDNHITRERNIHDGPFRDQFPWDFHIDNNVFQRLGVISYRVATGDAQLTRGKVGTIARINAVALKPTEGTGIGFKFTRKPRVNATKAVYVGEDVLGDPKVFGDGIKGTILQVLPAPEDDVAAAPAKEPRQ